jgi:hypothetical protein
MRFNFYRYQNDEPENIGGGAGDVPLGPKGEKALEATKQRARELEKELAAEREKNKKFEGLTPDQIQEAIEFQRTAKLEQAEREKNTEEARRLEREQAAAEKKRLQAEKEAADNKAKSAMAMLTETRIDAAIALNLSSTGIKPQYTNLLTKDSAFRSQLAYLTRAEDGVDSDGVYVVDKSGDPRYHPDDRNKYLPIDLWIETEVIKTYPDMFVARVATGDGLRGNRGKRGGGIPTDELSKMSPIQRAEWARKNR